MKVVILGDGLLGTEIYNQTGWDIVSRKKDNIDFKTIMTYVHKIMNYDVIVNCIADTDTYSNDRQKHWDINYVGLSKLVDFCAMENKKIVHISTDYIYSGSVKNATEEDVPVHCRNWYGYTKLLSDAYVQLKMENYLLVRCSFKPTPFPYQKALINQVGNFDFVDEIAMKIVQLIIKQSTGVFNVGTMLKTVYDLAMLNGAVEPMNVDLHETMPADVSMDTSKMDNELNG